MIHAQNRWLLLWGEWEKTGGPVYPKQPGSIAGRMIKDKIEEPAKRNQGFYSTYGFDDLNELATVIDQWIAKRSKYERNLIIDVYSTDVPLFAIRRRRMLSEYAFNQTLGRIETAIDDYMNTTKVKVT